MDTEIPPLTHLRSVETANSSTQQNGWAHCQSSVSSLSEKRENLMPEDFEQCKESHIPCRDAGDDANGAVQPDIISGKPRHQKEMTFQDVYNGLDYDDNDDDEDSDWEPSQELVLYQLHNGKP